jgi:16S rRNA (cytidine1402-2'-O)-methyltransferase
MANFTSSHLVINNFMQGRIFLIPVTLGNENPETVIPAEVIRTTCGIRHFVVENTRSARRYLRLIDRSFPIDESYFTELNEHTTDKEIEELLHPVKEGNDIGIMSEAGLPGIADPGARLVALAHQQSIKIVPLSGPSSIVLALIASGMNGQTFTFNGYLPVKPLEREKSLKEIERRASGGVAQIFMETPYRNQQLLDSVLQVCKPDTRLCIATDITLETESITTKRVSEWKRSVPAIKNRPSIFIIQ